MSTAVITIKTDATVKTRAQQIVEELGLSLSAVINGYLRQLIRTKSVSFSAHPQEIPNAYMRKALKQSAADIKAGRISRSFSNADEAIAYLHTIEHKKKSKKK